MEKAGRRSRRAFDENLIDIETDKVVLEIPAPQAGVLVSILRQQGDSVKSNELIATIDTTATASVQQKPSAAESRAAERCRRRPSFTAESGVNLAGVQGSGRDGRILKEDVAAHLARLRAGDRPFASRLRRFHRPRQAETAPSSACR